MKRNLFFLCLIVCVISACVTTEKSISDESIYSDFVGYEFVTDLDYFITEEDAQIFLRIPRSEHDSLRKFGGLPTIDSFRKETWDSSKQKGTEKYLDILPSGSKLKIVDIVMTYNMEIGRRYHYIAQVLENDEFKGMRINVNSLIESEFKGFRRRK